MNLDTIIAIGVAAAATVEFIKQSFLKALKDRFNLSDDAYRALVWLVVAVVGAFLAYSQNAVLPGWNAIISAIFIGIAASLPSNVLHALYDAVLGLADWLANKGEPMPQPPMVQAINTTHVGGVAG